jgi:hypothetical protein
MNQGKGLILLGAARPTLANIIASLFPSGSDGAAYEVSDLASLSQDSNGSIAGAVGSAIGLLSDERYGLVSGSTIVTNGTFDTNISSWTDTSNAGGAIAWNSGGAINLVNTTGFAVADQVIALAAGTYYSLTFTITANTGTASIRIGSSSGGTTTTSSGNITGTGTFTFRFPASLTSQHLALMNTSAGTVTIDNVSVVQVLGNHSSQSTAGSRPINTAYGSTSGALFDGLDDGLATSFGGGGTTGFFWCGAVKVIGGDGTARSIFSDAGTNTGYRVRLASTNSLAVGAGNGTAYTSATTADSVLAGNTYVLTVWDDGVNLNAQVNRGAIAQTARPSVSAGGPGFSLGKDNNASSSFANIALFEMFYVKNGSAVSAADRLKAQRRCAARAGISI